MWTTLSWGAMYSRVAAEQAPAGAPQVVLVHGLGASSRYMRPLMRQCAPRWRVYAPDLPGFGWTPAPRRTLGPDELAEALAQWMEALGLRDATLVGNSMGCQVVIHTAHRHPHLVGRGVLVGPTMDRGARTVPRHLARFVRAALLHESYRAYFTIALDYWQAGLGRVIRTFRRALDDPVEEVLPQVQQPMLVVWGSRDVIVSHRWAAEVAQRLPRGQLITMPGAPHMINYSQPAELERRISGFCSRSTCPQVDRA